MGMAQAYYRLLSQYALNEQPDIIGHFDVITKFNANNRFFDADSPAYRRLALEAIEAVAQSGTIVEVNTGGMAKGFTTTPYPAPFLLKRLLELGVPIVVNSDAHAAGMLDAHFATVRTLLRDIGFRETMEFTPSGFIPTPLL
jgi:histidinol-phosphatase (PHP family)